jgi:hypothetical protein
MWDLTKDVATVLSGVGTFLAFLAVAYQLRIMNRQMRIEAHNMAVQSDRELWKIVLENPSIAPNLLKARWSNTGKFEPSEELFSAMMIDHFENLFVRHRNGLIPAESWVPFQQYVVSTLLTAPVRAIWELNKRFYSPDFVRYFNDKLQRAQPSHG